MIRESDHKEDPLSSPDSVDPFSDTNSSDDDSDEEITDEEPDILDEIIPITQPFTKRDADIMNFLKRTVGDLLKHKYAKDFATPIDYKELKVEDYPDIVNKPLDLGTIHRRIPQFCPITMVSPKVELTEDSKKQPDLIMSSTAILNNIHRVWDNCYLYNGVDSPISSHARDLQRTFAEKLERMVERGFWDADVVESARTSTEFDIIRAKKGKKPRWFIQQRKQKSAATKESTDVKEEVFIIHTRKREPTSSLKPRPALTLVALPPTPILPSPSKITPATFTIPRRTRSERKVEPKSFFDDSELPETEKRTRREPLPPLPPPEPAIHFSPSDILTEEHPEDTTPLTSKEKEQLVDGMSSLTPVQRAPLVAFLHPYLPQASQEDLSSPPLLDIETLDAPIQHRLFRYVYHFLK